MKVILDECLPKRLGRHLVGHDVWTVPGAGLAGVSNGKLLKAITDDFEAFITIDGNMEYQQSLKDQPFLIIVLRAQSNRLDALLPLAPQIVMALNEGSAGIIRHIP